MSKNTKFEMSPYLVTEGDWEKLMGNNPSRQWNRPKDENAEDCPVQNVNWYDAVAYCNALSEKEGLTPYYTLSNVQGTPGKGDFKARVSRNPHASGYRLPTNEQWEAHLGEIPSSKDIQGHSWCWENSDGRTRPVGQKKPNEHGLYDMLGNVWEWTDTETD